MNTRIIQEIINRNLEEIDSKDVYKLVDAINSRDWEGIKGHIDNLERGVQDLILVHSVINDRFDVVKYLIDSNEKFMQSLNSISTVVLTYYAVEDNKEALEYLLNKCDKPSKKDMYELLMQACAVKADNSVKFLIDYIGFVNLAELLKANETIVFVENDIEKDVEENDVEELTQEEIDELEQYINTSVEVVDPQKETKDIIALFEMLLKNGISTSVKSEEGITPLQYIINTQNGKLITKLLEHHAYIKYNKKSALGYELRNLKIAEEDMMCLLKSDWYKNVKNKKNCIKEDIKKIIHCENDQELKQNVAEISKKRNLEDIKKMVENGDVEGASKDLKIILKQKLNKTNELLDIVERFKGRVELNTENKVFEVIDMCKAKGIRDLI